MVAFYGLSQQHRTLESTLNDPSIRCTEVPAWYVTTYILHTGSLYAAGDSIQTMECELSEQYSRRYL